MAPTDENVCQQRQSGVESTEPIKPEIQTLPKMESVEVPKSNVSPVLVKDTEEKKSLSKTQGAKRQVSELSPDVIESEVSSQPPKRARVGSLLQTPLAVLMTPVRLAQSGLHRVLHRAPVA